MIGDLKPYADYKESGLPWLGPVPAHWRTVRNGSLFGQRSQTGYAALPILEVSLKTGVQVRSFGQAGRKQIMSDLSKYKRAVKGDLAYNTMRMWQGALGVCPVDGLVSPAYVVARPYAGADARYFAALFRTGDYMAEIDSASRGIVKDRNRLYWDQFKQMQSPCPPPDEQALIVRFLDWANGRLERAIRAKRKVIALLTEQKQAIIRQAVTRGLDAKSTLKPTGIPWLGTIPEHWEVRRLGSAISVLTGYPFVSSAFVRREGAVRLLRGVNVTPSGVRWADVVRWQRAQADRLEAFELKAGDIVLGMDRPVVSTGVRATSIKETDTPALLVQRVARMRATDKLHARFLLLLLRGGIFAEYMTPIFTGISVPHLSPEQIKAFKVMLPPFAEQVAIADSVEVETDAIEKSIAKIEREIDLLREYRTRLIADVVTGKLDVRDAAAQLPEDHPSDAAGEFSEEADEAEFTDEEAAEA